MTITTRNVYIAKYVIESVRKILRDSNTIGCTSFFRKAPEEVSKLLQFADIKPNRERFTVKEMCRVLGVCEAGFYKNLRNPQRAGRDAVLLVQIYELLKEDKENTNYGVNRIYDYLR